MEITYTEPKDTRLKYIVSLSKAEIQHIEEGGTISGSSKANPDEFIMIGMEEIK
jgi:hypothetical protein